MSAHDNTSNRTPAYQNMPADRCIRHCDVGITARQVGEEISSTATPSVPAFVPALSLVQVLLSPADNTGIEIRRNRDAKGTDSSTIAWLALTHIQESIQVLSFQILGLDGTFIPNL